MFYSLKDDRKAADERLRKEQEKVDRALQAARNAGDKDREVKELAAQVDKLTVRSRIIMVRREFNKGLISSTEASYMRYTS